MGSGTKTFAADPVPSFERRGLRGSDSSVPKAAFGSARRSFPRDEGSPRGGNVSLSTRVEDGASGALCSATASPN